MIDYIFRHGETFFTKNNVPYGDNFETAEILPESIPVIERLGNYLNGKLENDNYTSPFKRAIQTVEIIEKITGKKFVPDERIREEELSRAQETLVQMEERLRNFISGIENGASQRNPSEAPLYGAKGDNKIENCAICSHGWPIAALISILTKNRVTKFDLSCFPKCGVLTIVEILPDKTSSTKTLDFN